MTAGAVGAVALTGAAFAHSGSGDGPGAELKDRVAEILGVDAADLHDAVTTARGELVVEHREERLSLLVEAGTITEAQADEISDWHNARPDVLNEIHPGFGRGHGRSGMHRGMPGNSAGIENRLDALVEAGTITQAQSDEVSAWLDDRPEVLDELRPERPHRGRGFGGRGSGGRGFGGHGLGGGGFESPPADANSGNTPTVFGA